MRGQEHIQEFINISFLLVCLIGRLLKGRKVGFSLTSKTGIDNTPFLEFRIPYELWNTTNIPASLGQFKSLNHNNSWNQRLKRAKNQYLKIPEQSLGQNEVTICN